MGNPCDQGNDDDSEQSMHPVYGHQCIERQIVAGSGHAQGSPEREALSEIHVRHPFALTQRETAAGERRVVGTDPSAQGNLHKRCKQRQRCGNTECT